MPVARLRPISRHVAAVDLHGRFQVAAFLVRHSKGLALVDAGFPGWEYAILTAASSLPEPNHITHTILTHAHSDHIGGAAGLAAQTPCEVICGEEEKPYIEGLSLASAAQGLGSKVVLGLNHLVWGRRVGRVRIDRTLRPGETVLDFEVVPVPGHTPGQIALLHKKDRVVLCADSVFHVQGCIGHDPIPGMTADHAVAVESMRRIADLGIADIAPSHGPAILGDGPARIRAYLEETEG